MLLAAIYVTALALLPLTLYFLGAGQVTDIIGFFVALALRSLSVRSLHILFC